MQVVMTNVNHLKQYTPEKISQIQDGMRPGNHSSAGFLIWDDNLIDVYNQDLQFLDKAEISHEQIADSLKGLIRKADAIQDFSLEKIIGKKFKISGSGIATNGYQECPFPLNNEVNCFEGRRDYKITNLKSNEFFILTDLGIHLAEKHGFYQGNTPYRMDPSQVIKVLDLKAGEYQKITVKEWKWVGTCDYDDQAKYETRLTKKAKQIIKIDGFAVAYLGVPFNDNYVSYKYNGKTEREKLTHQYQKQNLSDLEIQTKIEKDDSKWSSFGFSSSLDKQYNHPIGKEYLHFINKKDRNDNLRGVQKLKIPRWNPVVDGGMIKENVSHKENYIFEKVEFSYADIDCD